MISNISIIELEEVGSINAVFILEDKSKLTVCEEKAIEQDGSDPLFNELNDSNDIEGLSAVEVSVLSVGREAELFNRL